MIRSQHLLLLVALALPTSLSGCGVWDAWRCRWSGSEQACVAFNDGQACHSSGIHPGHSTDSSNETPYSDGPSESVPTERLAPQPTPSSSPSLPPSNPDQPIIEQDARLQQSTDGENKLIKTLKSPRMFTPESVRSIYDRLRGNEADEAPPEKPTGPIAQNHIRESPTRACLYTAEHDSTGGPVQLGLPETDVFPEEYDRVLTRDSSDGRDATRPRVMQAGPSSYRHPLLADPTGVPYSTR